MGRNKRLRKQIAGLQAVIAEHHQKIARELMKTTPDRRLIVKWRKDIAVFEREIAKLLRKLGKENHDGDAT